MPKFLLATILSLAVGSAALAQPVTPSGQPESPVSNAAKASGTTIKGTSGKTVRVPPGNMPATRNKAQGSAIGANVPTTPQIGRRPTGTIGSGTPIAGPGGTTQSPVGN